MRFMSETYIEPGINFLYDRFFISSAGSNSEIRDTRSKRGLSSSIKAPRPAERVASADFSEIYAPRAKEGNQDRSRGKLIERARGFPGRRPLIRDRRTHRGAVCVELCLTVARLSETAAEDDRCSHQRTITRAKIGHFCASGDESRRKRKRTFSDGSWFEKNPRRSVETRR